MFPENFAAFPWSVEKLWPFCRSRSVNSLYKSRQHWRGTEKMRCYWDQPMNSYGTCWGFSGPLRPLSLYSLNRPFSGNLDMGNPTESDWIRPNLTESDRIWPNPTESDRIRLNPTKLDLILPNPTVGFGRSSFWEGTSLNHHNDEKCYYSQLCEC